MSIWDTAAHQVNLQHLRNNPESAALCFELLHRLERGQFDRSLVDGFVQRRDGEDFTTDDAISFGRVFYSLITRHVLLGRLDIGLTPLPDRCRDENHQALQALGDFVDCATGDPLAHLVESRGLARWPYGSTAVTFFFVPDTYDIKHRTR
jgi:hypothetical protein